MYNWCNTKYNALLIVGLCVEVTLSKKQASNTTGWRCINSLVHNPLSVIARGARDVRHANFQKFHEIGLWFRSTILVDVLFSTNWVAGLSPSSSHHNHKSYRSTYVKRGNCPRQTSRRYSSCSMSPWHTCGKKQRRHFIHRPSGQPAQVYPLGGNDARLFVVFFTSVYTLRLRTMIEDKRDCQTGLRAIKGMP